MIASAANAAWFLSALPAERLFCAALDDPRRAQEKILRRYLAANGDTVIARRYGFADIRTIEQFQRRVPLHDYDALAPDIERIAAGETGVLTADRVVRLATSSGSTAAEKLIPYTAELQREFNRAISPWIVDLFRDDPQLVGGCAYWSITPVGPRGPQRANRNGPPSGFEEDSAYLGGARKRLIDAVMAVPSEVRHAADFATFRRATLDQLLHRPDLRLISVWHPSFLELLLGDEADFDWRAHWPSLRLISCWADAHAAAPAAALSQRFPGVRLQPKGLLATEAFVTIPYAGYRPLAVRSHFFEFLDEGDQTCLADELQPGVRYGVAVTTAGGLWRYRLGDAIEVEGYVGRTPSLRFVGREDSVSDLRGEKLSEGFVGRAIREVLAASKLTATFSMLAPEQENGAPRYVLYIESPVHPTDLAARLDGALRANPHYAQCRLLGQLAPAGVCHIPENAFAKYAAQLSRAGQRLGDIKPSPLSRRSWAQTFSQDARENGEG